jgi:hypothetical protein
LLERQRFRGFSGKQVLALPFYFYSSIIISPR